MPRLSAVVLHLPVGGFKLCAKEGVMEMESDVLSCRCFLRHFRQTEHNPGVDLCKTELSYQTESVHGPVGPEEKQGVKDIL